MKRLMKREGQFNFVLEDAPIPSIEPQQVLVRNKVTLISRGSEIGGRYTSEGVVAHSSMGYSAAGVIEEVGGEVTGVSPGTGSWQALHMLNMSLSMRNRGLPFDVCPMS